MENSTLFLDVSIRSLPLKEERDSHKEQTPIKVSRNLSDTDGLPDEFLSGFREADELENKPYFLVAPKEKSHRHEGCMKDDMKDNVIGAPPGADFTLLDDGRLKVNSCPVVSCY